MKKFKRVIGILILITISIGFLTINSSRQVYVKAETMTIKLPNGNTFTSQERIGQYPIDIQVLRYVCNKHAWQAWDGSIWYHTRFSDEFYKKEYYDLQAKGYEDQTPQDGLNEEIDTRIENTENAPEVFPGVSHPEYDAYSADYWGVMVMYLEYAKVTIKYVDENNVEISPSKYNDTVKKGSYTYYAEDLTSKGYTPIENSKQIIIEPGDNKTITFRYKKNEVPNKVTVKYIEEANGADIVDPDIFYNVAVGPQTYYRKDLTSMNYTLNDDVAKTITVESGKEYTVIFKYKKKAVIKPNLLPTSIKLTDTNGVAETEVVKGEQYKVEVIINNNSSVSAGGSYTALFIDDVYLSKSATMTLLPNSSTKVIFNFTPMKSGLTKFTAEADYDKVIDESDETDNRYSEELGALVFVDPLVDVIAPYEVVLGDDVFLIGSGKTEDRHATSLQGKIIIDGQPGINGTNPIQGIVSTFPANSTNKSTAMYGTIWFSVLKTYTVTGVVVDSNGRAAVSNPKRIRTIEPIPKVIITKSGVEKENRKITIDASNSFGGSQRYGIDWTTAKWEIIAMSGGSYNDIRIQKSTTGATNGEIMVDSSRAINKSLTGLQKFDIQLKKAGQYKVKCTLTNTYGKSNSAEIILNIQDDTVPKVGFSLTSVLVRNPSDNNSSGFAQATQTIIDNQTAPDGNYSIDGDSIELIAWMYSFDSNNNGTFDDENWYVYNSGNNTWEYVGNYSAAQNFDLDSKQVGCLRQVQLKIPHVGKYDVQVKVREKFGQEYIPQFITNADKKTNYSFEN